jgi:5S rRNA maturation endonuclease (ribonuclease M5)
VTYSPKTPLIFEKHSKENTSHTRKKHLSPVEGVTPLTSGDNPSLPNTSLKSGAYERNNGHDADAQNASTSDSGNAGDTQAAPVSDSEHDTSTAFIHVGEAKPSVQPNPKGGKVGMDSNDSVRKSVGDEMLVDCAVDDEYPEPTTAEMRRIGERDYAIAKSKEWRQVPRETRDKVKSLIKRCEVDWEYWATHDDGEALDESNRKAGSFPCPSDTYKIMLAQFLQEHTDLQVIRAWNKFLLRPQGFDGLDYRLAAWVIFKHDFEILVEDEEKSSNEVRRQQVWRQPPLEAFVKAFDAESEGDCWVARCPFPANHEHGDSNLSLVISQKDGKVLVHCRAGCNQRDVWDAAVAKARDVAVDDLEPLEVKASKPKSEFKATSDDVAILHARLSTVPAVQSWLKEYGITSKTADKLQLGAHESVSFKVHEKDDDGKIKIKHFTSAAVLTPHYDLSGKLVGVKARAVPVKAFTQEDGSSIDGLFAATHLNPSADEVLVLEGDKDVAIAMSHGFNATGIISAQSKLSDADIETLTKYKRIYLVGDQDSKGVAAMNRIATRLPKEQAIHVQLPTKDVGELFQRHSSDFKNQLRTQLVRSDE